MDENFYSKRPNYKFYPESVRQEVVREYLTTECSKAYLRRKYGIGSSQIILHWLKKYGNSDCLSPVKPPEQIHTEMAEDTPEIRALKARIKQLERELEDSKLLAEAYSLMITTAEEQLKIPIRKKFNTK
jgi:transposase-like protein